MLNTDFYVFFNVTLDNFGKATCQLDTNCGHMGTCGLLGKCGMSPTYEIGLLYSKVHFNQFGLYGVQFFLLGKRACFARLSRSLHQNATYWLRPFSTHQNKKSRMHLKKLITSEFVKNKIETNLNLCKSECKSSRVLVQK